MYCLVSVSGIFAVVGMNGFYGSPEALMLYRIAAAGIGLPAIIALSAFFKRTESLAESADIKAKVTVNAGRLFYCAALILASAGTLRSFAGFMSGYLYSNFAAWSVLVMTAAAFLGVRSGISAIARASVIYAVLFAAALTAVCIALIPEYRAVRLRMPEFAFPNDIFAFLPGAELLTLPSLFGVTEGKKRKAALCWSLSLAAVWIVLITAAVLSAGGYIQLREYKIYSALTSSAAAGRFASFSVMGALMTAAVFRMILFVWAASEQLKRLFGSNAGVKPQLSAAILPALGALFFPADSTEAQTAMWSVCVLAAAIVLMYPAEKYLLRKNKRRRHTGSV